MGNERKHALKMTSHLGTQLKRDISCGYQYMLYMTSHLGTNAKHALNDISFGRQSYKA